MKDSTWQERSMGAYMRGAWAAFARCPETGLLRYGWDTSSNHSLLQLGLGNVSSNAFSVLPTYNVSTAYDTACGTFSYIGGPNG